MDKAKKEALQELLRLLADNPDLADRITITIKPNSKPQQGERQEHSMPIFPLPAAMRFCPFTTGGKPYIIGKNSF